MAFIDKWSFFGGYTGKDRTVYLEDSLFYFIKEDLLKCGLYLQGGLYSEVAINKGSTV